LGPDRGFHLGQRSCAASKGRTHDRSRPTRQNLLEALEPKGPSTHGSSWRCASSTPLNAPAAGRTPQSAAGGTGRFADAGEHIRWRLWHGQTARAFRLIRRTLAAVKTKAEAQATAARSAAKLAKALLALETNVSGLADLIIDYASARLDGEPFSTSPTEGAVQWRLHRRMGAQQQMRWSPRGAHLMLQVRTAIVNGTFDADHRDICRRRRSFRMAA
jgi:hypothetical protein